jgi:murein DD-endopeptidase MepM/ murein hydrolase activator NlpD
MKTKYILVVCFLLVISSNVSFARGLWFPISGIYPYTAEVTAMPDLDTRPYYIRTRMGETGKRGNGCVPDTSYLCNQTYDKNKSVWGYKKDGGGNWNVDGILYKDWETTGGLTYMWYDNHNGYDFSDRFSGYKGREVHATENGTVISVNADWGQVEVEHVVYGTTYRMTYTHMDLSKTASKLYVGKKVLRWDLLGTVSNKTPVGVSVGYHLHFTVKKSGVVVDPYGQWKSGVEVEPYLWE